MTLVELYNSLEAVPIDGVSFEFNFRTTGLMPAANMLISQAARPALAERIGIDDDGLDSAILALLAAYSAEHNPEFVTMLVARANEQPANPPDTKRESGRATMQAPREIRLQVNNGPDVHFEGGIAYEYSTQSKGDDESRWTELRLWETVGGAWIAESVGRSTSPGQVDLRDVLVIEPTEEELHATGPRQHQLLLDWQYRVMAFFGWTTGAKAFAREAGWDVAVRVP